MGFMTAFNAADTILTAPLPSSGTNLGESNLYTWVNATKLCSAENKETRLPNKDEMSAMMINRDLIRLESSSNESYWSSTTFDIDNAWGFSTYYGIRSKGAKTFGLRVRCVKR